MKEYSIPLPSGLPFKHVNVTLSIPQITRDRKKLVRFSEHVLDANTGGVSNRVIACAVGGYYISDNLGVSWDWVGIRGFENVRFVNSFTLPDGSICLQSKGLIHNLSKEDQQFAGLKVTVDNRGKVVSAITPSQNQWHGSSSIDFHDGVLIFADYALNLPIGKASHAERYPSAVFRSIDFGASFVKSFECPGTAVRHFHTVRADPFLPGTWYLTSGDLPHETNVWISSDNGITWHEALLGLESAMRAQFRLTDMVFFEKGIIWGSDDILGSSKNMSNDLPVSMRSGARLFFAERNKINEPVEIGYIGQPIRSIVDLGLCWFVITQGSFYESLTRPRVFLLTKEKPFRVIHLFDVDNHSDLVTGFTYSCSSRAAKDGIFFTVRGPNDVFIDPLIILKWSVIFG